MSFTSVYFFIALIVSFSEINCIESLPHSQTLKKSSLLSSEREDQLINNRLLTAGKDQNNYLFLQNKFKRSTENIIEECIFMTSEEGNYYHRSSLADGTVCGIYIISEPDQKIEVRFNYFDVSCDNGGLASFVDGWELNGEFFPSPDDHPRPMGGRFTEFCGRRKIKQIFTSSQNVALIQYRMPNVGSRFSISIRFHNNLTPCNVLLQNTETEYTIRNYQRRANCSLSTIFPAAVKIQALNVGIDQIGINGIEMETGTMHKCEKHGLDDFVQIGGSSGLDNTNLLIANSICGLNSRPSKFVDLIGCGTSTIRLVSSGAFDNSVTVHVRPLVEQDILNHLTVVCPEITK